MNDKVRMSVDKRGWTTSPLPGQIVLVSTVDKGGVPNVAPKSWFSMVARKPAVVGFGCNLKHQTAKNVLATREFVVNFPSVDSAGKVWRAGESAHSGAARLSELGFTLVPSLRVSPPMIRECRAHLECKYESDKRYGDEVWFFGEVVSAVIDGKALVGSAERRYGYLAPIFYLEEKTYGVLGEVRTVQKT